LIYFHLDFNVLDSAFSTLQIRGFELGFEFRQWGDFTDWDNKERKWEGSERGSMQTMSN